LDLTYSDNEWIDILNSMGYNIEAFGDNTYIVREIPTFMTLEEAESFVNVFIDSYNDDRKTTNQVVIDKLITKACKSSIKANDYIKDNEIAALIEDLKNCRNPFSCPHGRPTFIKFSKYDIEKMFKRIQ
ncbi:MAG: DNA mismatch repair protein MutL, partial [Firmicutes bacterium]|nr:DNA mismatch repair protein MutL [Bacillota bacterium]